MPSVADVERIRADFFAEDVPIPQNIYDWSLEQIERYFESGGEVVPGGTVFIVAETVQ